jgi:hypothetical protein
MNNLQYNVLVSMFENIELWLSPLLGFAVTYLALEVAWHFTACGLHSKEIKPCLFKEVKEIVVRHR